MEDLSIHAAEAMPLDSASNRDAAMRQLEKISAMAKALTAERLLLGTRATDKKRRQELDEEFEVYSEAMPSIFAGASMATTTFARSATVQVEGHARTRLLLRHQCHGAAQILHDGTH